MPFARVLCATVAAVPLADTARALEIDLYEMIALLPVAHIAESELGCAPADASGVVCAGGPAVSLEPDPPFQLEQWDIAVGPGARLEATFSISDLGEPKPNAAGIVLSYADADPVRVPFRLAIAASLEIADANGDGAASLSAPFSAELVGAGYSDTPVFVPIDPPVVSVPFGSALTEAERTLDVAEPEEWLGLMILFAASISPGDAATVRIALEVVPIPEPRSGALVSLALLALSGIARSARRPAQPRGYV